LFIEGFSDISSAIENQRDKSVIARADSVAILMLCREIYFFSEHILEETDSYNKMMAPARRRIFNQRVVSYISQFSAVSVISMSFGVIILLESTLIAEGASCDCVLQFRNHAQHDRRQV
jgi:hypothetical protein